MRSGYRLIQLLAALTCGGMLLVLVMGAAVTNTGSAEGCGRSWPLCNGQFIPEFTVATAIEFSHRAVTGLESLLVVALSVVMLWLWRRAHIGLVALMLGTLLLQAGLGAGAVLWPQSPLMLATHFGVSLVCFAATFLSAVVVFERTGGGALRRGTGHFGFSVLALVYVLFVVYLGAYVRHSGVSLACTDWPLCNGQVVPPLDAATGVVFAHRVAAAGAVVLLGALATKNKLAVWPFGLSVLQAFSGALIVWTYLGLFSTLLHAAIMGLLFASLTYVVRAERNNSVLDRYGLRDHTARGVQTTLAVSPPHGSTSVASSSGVSAPADGRAVADDAGSQRAVAAQRAAHASGPEA